MSQIFIFPKLEPLPWTSVKPRPLHPLSTPRQDGSKAAPALPWEASRRANGKDVTRIIPGFTLSTHMFQAAGPRTKCKTGPTPKFPVSSPSRRQDIATVGAEIEAARHLSKECVYEDGWPEDPLWIVANRFVNHKALLQRERSEPILTLTFMHSNGTSKETWEETIKAMLEHYPTLQGTVDEMWSLDVINGGDSALVNEGYLGNVLNWQDHARDLQQFLLYYLPEQIESELPIHLVPLSEQVCESRQARGFDSRQLVAIGQSIGGAATIRAAIDTPALFYDVILVDPVIHSPALYNAVVAAFIPSSATIGRREEWPSRKSAMESYRKSPLFASWDAEVLQAYVDHCLAENPTTGAVTLKTSGYQEAIVFAERRLPMEIWELLPRLDDRVKLYLIMNGKESPTNLADASLSDKVSMPDSVWQRKHTVWRREVNTSNVGVKDSGHLITQTMPHVLGEEIGSRLINISAANRKIVARL